MLGHRPCAQGTQRQTKLTGGKTSIQEISARTIIEGTARYFEGPGETLMDTCFQERTEGAG